MGERPSANVPWVAMAAENVGNNSCGQSATFTNVSCALPPDQVNVTMKLQTILDIADIAQTMTLNIHLTYTWNDWRLAYVEGGVSCWTATSGVLLTGGADSVAAAAYVSAQMLPVLLAAWGCTGTPSTCTLLPAGVAPTVNVSVLDAQHLALTVYPAPPNTGLGLPDPTGMTAALSASLDSVLAAYTGVSTLASGADGSGADWAWASVLCTGADARALPPQIALTPGGSTGSNPMTANPSTLDALAIWMPEFEDSLNQVSDETIIEQHWFVKPNGDIKVTEHYVADFAISMQARHAGALGALRSTPRTSCGRAGRPC